MIRNLLPDDIASHCLDVLKAEGYKVHTETLRIVELSFDFDQVLTGPRDHHGLVLLVDQRSPGIDALKRRLSSLALALSRTSSQRPVTLILIAPPLGQEDLEKLRHLARTVAIDRIARSINSVDHILREFRTLQVHDVSAPLVDALDELTNVLGKEAKHPHVRRLIRAASNGADAVDQAFRTLLNEVIEESSGTLP